jgi:hypothetical protein
VRPGHPAVPNTSPCPRSLQVYVQPALLGWRPPLLSWLATLPAAVTPALKQQLTQLFDWLVPPMLRVANKLLRSPQPMQVRRSPGLPCPLHSCTAYAAASFAFARVYVSA